MGIRVALAACLLTAPLSVPLFAQDLSCIGDGWQLTIKGAVARLDYLMHTQMELMLTTPAERRDWPKALSLVGDRDTAIVIVDARNCGDAPLTAEVLTQRGQTPVLLTGCCEGRL